MVVVVLSVSTSRSTVTPSKRAKAEAYTHRLLACLLACFPSPYSVNALGRFRRSKTGVMPHRIRMKFYD